MFRTRSFRSSLPSAAAQALVGSFSIAVATVACGPAELTIGETGISFAGRSGASGSSTAGSGVAGKAGAAGSSPAGSSGTGGKAGMANGGAAPLTVDCPPAAQDSVDTSGWPEIFVGTHDHACRQAEDIGVGSSDRPYCNPHAALAAVKQAGTIVTFLGGEYRLADLPKPGTSGVGGLALPAVSTSASAFVVVRAAKGAKTLLLGSTHLHAHRTGWKKWTGPPGSPTIYRLSVESLRTDPQALYEVAPYGDPPHEMLHRFRHVGTGPQEAAGHADVDALLDGVIATVEASATEPSTTRDFTWTKADANGKRCGTANMGCYFYLRIDDPAYDPEPRAYEISQVPAFEGASSWPAHTVIDGLESRFTQCAGPGCATRVVDADEVVVRNCRFGHIAGPAAFELAGTSGSKVYDNEIFDVASWEGGARSKGIVFSRAGEKAPNWICRNDVHHIPGAAVGSGSDVRDLRVLGNDVHEATVGVGTSRSNDTQLLGGAWIVQQNLFRRCGTAVAFEGTFASPAPMDKVVNNVFVDNRVGVGFTGPSASGTSVHNNVFLGGVLSNACEAAGCGAAIHLQSDDGVDRDFGFVFGWLDTKSSHNAFFGLAQPYALVRKSSPVYEGFDIAAIQTLYAAEQGSLVSDPLLDADYRPLPGSPLLGAGNGAVVGRSSVHIGRFLD